MWLWCRQWVSPVACSLIKDSPHLSGSLKEQPSSGARHLSQPSLSAKVFPTCPALFFSLGHLARPQAHPDWELGDRGVGKIWPFSFPSRFLQFKRVGANHNWVLQPQRSQSKSTSQPQPQQEELITAKCGESFSGSTLEAIIYPCLISKPPGGPRVDCSPVIGPVWGGCPWSKRLWLWVNMFIS